MTEYIKDMRKLVGKKPIIQCGASLIIFNKNNEVLLLKRKDINCWCFPGGSVELGESTKETAVREAKEETGLDIDINDLKLFQVFSGMELYYKYPNGDEVYNVDVVYTTKTFKGAIELSGESTEYCFFSVYRLPKEISLPVIPVVEYLLKNI